LAIHHPHNTGVHGGTKNFQLHNFTSFAESLLFHGMDAKEEYYGRSHNSINYPTDDPFPAK